MSWYDPKQSYGETRLMVELWGIQSTPLLPSLPGPLCRGMVAPCKVLPMDQIELNCGIMLNWIVWNRTVYTYKTGLVSNNLQWLMCHQTKWKTQTHNNPDTNKYCRRLYRVRWGFFV